MTYHTNGGNLPRVFDDKPDTHYVDIGCEKDLEIFKELGVPKIAAIVSLNCFLWWDCARIKKNCSRTSFPADKGNASALPAPSP